MKDFESNRTQIMNSIENRVRQAYNSGYDMGFHDGEIAGYNKTDIWQDGYYKGLEEAWECAKKLTHPSYGGFYDDEQEKIFGYRNSDEVLTNFTAYEAIEKIREYESKLNEPDKEYEIQIGDEVMSMFGDKGYVTGIKGDEFCVLYPNGTVGHSSKSTYSFTGKSNPLIKDILEQMKGAAE